jgi:lipopolysaccharide export system permease protein
MIVERYLLREIVKPQAVILCVLSVLFTSYGAAEFLSNAVNGLLPIDMIVQLVGLRTLIALEVLIPISLYFAVILAFGRMYGESELAAMSALGVSSARVMGVVIALSLCTAAGVAALSLLARPWAYQRSHELSDRASASLETDAMAAGTFYVGSQGDRTIFIERRAQAAAPGHDVFVQLRLRGVSRVIYAATVEQTRAGAPEGHGGGGLPGGSELRFTDAHVYDIALGTGAADVVMHVQSLVVRLANPQIEAADYSSVAASTAHLAAERSAADIAELQWRLSTSWSTLLLGMLAVPLSRSGPRQQRYAKIGLAMLIYAGYYLLYESARTWVQNGVIPRFPGLWWVPGLLAALVLGAALGPALRRRLRRARAP